MYLDYAPLFDAMHGAKWLLSSAPAQVKAIKNARSKPTVVNSLYSGADSAPSFNVFSVAAPGANNQQSGVEQAALPAALLVPIMLANSTTSVTLTLNLTSAVVELGWPTTTSLSGTAVLHPSGNGVWMSLGRARLIGSGSFAVTVPLVRGCALVRTRPLATPLDASQPKL